MRIAFVTPWYSEAPLGGAELEAKGTVENLHRVGVEVEVATTCVEDFRANWNVNHYPPGRSLVNGVPVTRFKADPRNGPLFDQVNKRLMRGEPITAVEEEVYIREGIRSRDLEQYLAEQSDQCRFVFIPYMFGTTYWGSQVCPEQSYIIPCLHDEIYAHLRIYKPMFQRVRGVLFHTRAERDLAQALYGLSDGACILVGEGVNTEVEGRGQKFRRKYGVADPFVLHVGRKDVGKNVAQLADFFARYRLRRSRPLKLVTLGPGSLEVPPGLQGEVLDLGFVPLQDKYDAYSAAEVLWQPSLNESFSLVLMEAWLCGTPALVNGGCAATREQCLASNGGLYYNDYPEFEAALDWLLDNPDLGRRIAYLGREYVRSNFHWDRIVARLKQALCQ